MDTYFLGFPERFFQLPKLKSVVAVFFGLFCILCFKKLIGFGRRWKDILIDWGYRSLNVPSLWTSDAVVDPGTSVGPSPTTPPPPSPKHSKRVPALRVPDAWSNFLLTWLHLNLNIVSNLIPAWISAINGELRKLSSRALARDDQCSDESFTPYRELRIEAVRPPICPPRLSYMETSASGSTKELHFHCYLSSPEIFLDLTAVRQIPDSETAQVTNRFVVNLRQVACRVQIICAVLEGDYTLLSWRLVSPLLTHNFNLLNQELQPVTDLSASDSRWIKDNLYLAIQSTVTRLVISPLCFTPIEESFPRAPRLPTTSRSVLSSPTSQEAALPSASPDLQAYPSSMSLSNPAMHIRVLYAVLLEPLELSASDPLLTTPLQCRIRWNLTLARGGVSTVDDGAEILLTTKTASLEPKVWPSVNQDSSSPFMVGRSPSRPMTNSFMILWNQDAYIPVTEVYSNLLDVSLFTEPATDSNACICGHAIMPLPKLNDDPAKSQHVLLIDCYSGNPTDDWHNVSKSPDIRARFMLILRVQLFSAFPTTESCQDDAELSVVRGVTQAGLSSAAPSPSVRNRIGSIRSRNSSSLREASGFETKYSNNTLSHEQLAEFMSPPEPDSEFTVRIDGIHRRRSRSCVAGQKVPLLSVESDRNHSSESHFDTSDHWANHNVPFMNLPPGDYSPLSIRTTTGVEISPNPLGPQSPSVPAKKRFNLRRSLSKSWRKKNPTSHSTNTIDSPQFSASPSIAIIGESNVTTNNSAHPGKSKFKRLLRTIGVKSSPSSNPHPHQNNRRQSE